MKKVDEIIYDALRADAGIMEATCGRIVSTCFEIPPTEDDNTPIPYIIIADDGFQNQQTTKDMVWEAFEDQVQVSVEIAAASPGEVDELLRKVRRAVEQYVVQMYEQGEDTPELVSLSSDGKAWDWEKPCYFTHLTYQCIIKADTEDEQEDGTAGS